MYQLHEGKQKKWSYHLRWLMEFYTKSFAFGELRSHFCAQRDVNEVNYFSCSSKKRKKMCV
jgi:hypothetical protein